jgi:AcrR family transcriptional regulator
MASSRAPRVQPRTATFGWERRRRILLGEYERIALELFADRGFHDVTVDDIAAAAGVTTRTLFRYFPSKQDCLLGFPRRGLQEELEMIKSLDPSDDPLTTAWNGLRDFTLAHTVDPEVMDLWRAAAAGAPDVVSRVRGERTYAVNAALLEYCERSLGVDANVDPRPRVIAGLLTGIELALVEAGSRVPGVLDAVIDTAADVVRATPRGPRVARRPGRRTKPLHA